jgi:nicotinamidase-related amidase
VTTALIVIDVQNDYFPGGKMELEGSLEASFCAQQALAAWRGKRWRNWREAA